MDAKEDYTDKLKDGRFHHDRRHLLWVRLGRTAGLGAVLLVAAAGVSLLILARPYATPVSKENCSRVQTGMTRAEVESILGPATDLYPADSPYAGSLLGWESDSLTVLAVMGEDGTLAQASLLPHKPDDASKRVRKRLGLAH